MAPEIDRLDRLEDGLRQTQDSILLMSKDIHSMNESITSIAESMKTLVEVKQEIAIINERQESRHNQLKDADKLLHNRVDAIVKKDEVLEKQAEKGETAYKILVQLALWAGAPLVAISVGAVLYVIQLQGAK